MYAHESAGVELLRLVLTFYLTVGIMAIGFATMFAGPRGASAAARLFFVRPLQLLIGALQSGVALFLGGIWTGFGTLISKTARALWRELKELAADARWLFTGRAR